MKDVKLRATCDSKDGRLIDHPIDLAYEHRILRTCDWLGCCSKRSCSLQDSHWHRTHWSEGRLEASLADRSLSTTLTVNIWIKFVESIDTSSSPLASSKAAECPPHLPWQTSVTGCIASTATVRAWGKLARPCDSRYIYSLALVQYFDLLRSCIYYQESHESGNIHRPPVWLESLAPRMVY